MQDHVIDVHGISKSFYHRKVVNSVDLQVDSGDIYGFLGPNGSGKTTTMRMLCGLLPIDAGEGTCLGYDVRRNSDAIKPQVGYMTQKFSLYSDLTVEENLTFYARLFNLANPHQQAAQIIKKLEIGKARSKQLAGTLSGGWKQRLALGAAIIHHPRLLLLDEPTAGVDPKARRDFWEIIFNLSQQGITTLVSTHYMDEAERCNKLAYIAYGQLLAKGSCQEVIDQAGLQTWQVRAQDLAELKKQLEAIPVINQVSAFGRDLHVNAQVNVDLNPIITATAHKAQWQRISPTLEDVFIHLMQQHQDNFS